MNNTFCWFFLQKTFTGPKMSTEAELVDQQRFDTAIATVRSDEDGIDRKSWLIVGMFLYKEFTVY